MNGIFIKLRTWWETSDRLQKVITLGGGGLLLALLIGTFVIASRPKMSIAFANLTPGDAGTVMMDIEALSIPVTMEGGNISVPSDKVDVVRAKLAQAGKLPKAAHPGYEGLTNMGMMNTPKVEEERLKSMLEGELARSVEQFDGVDSGTVHLTFGENSPFASEQKEAAATVTVSERGGASVTAAEGKAMATLVASSVPGMDAKKVAVFSRDGRAIYDGQSADDANGAAVTKLDMEHKAAEVKRQQLQETLNRVVGPGNAIVTVNCTIDNNKEIDDSNTPIPVKTPTEEQKLTEKMAGTNGGATPPTTTPDNTRAPGSVTNNSNSSNDYSRTQNLVSRATGYAQSHVEKGVGEVKTMAVTVFLNKPKSDDPDAATQAQEKEEAVRRAVNTFLGLAKQNPTAQEPALGTQLAFLPKDGFTSQIISYPFDDEAQKATTKAVTEQAGAQRMAQILNIVPAVILVLLALFVFKQLGKINGGPAVAYAGAGGYATLPMGPGGYASAALPAPVNPVHEEIRQKALEAGISEDELNAAMAAAQEQGINLEDIPSIGKRINLPLEQIRKMGEERPEVVATLIKSWLLEDRR